MAASKEPRLPMTFPNHTEQKSIVLSACACTIISASPAPRMDCGSAALWVQLSTSRAASCSAASRSTLRMPRMFDFTASQGRRSSNGRCLCAAMWKTTSGRVKLSTC